VTRQDRSPAQTCPDGGRYTTNGADLSFCLYENLALPVPSPIADCSALLYDDQIGLSWRLTDNPAPYCDYLDDGYIGYLWRQCPPSGTFSNSPTEAFCNFTFRAPIGAQAYCGNLSQGVFGYTYDGGGMCLIPGITPGTNLQADCGNVTQGQLGYHWMHPAPM
jgi:hypothetical protein